jgi:hypothetical protein
LLMGIRDEFISRPWQPPGRHWPGSPLVGGRDEQAGGTWLAVDPDALTVACVLNGRGRPAAENIRRTRGELPLGRMGDLASYDPFHLVRASYTEVSVLSWDGERESRRLLGPGTHVITNVGLDPDDPKVRYFGPKFAAHRPSGVPSVPSASAADAWRPWQALADGDGLPPDDPRAIRVRRRLPDGRDWGTTSISYVALSMSAMRYDFQSIPGDFYEIK